MDMEGVEVTAADQCMFGLKTWGMDGKSWESAMKKTRFMSNSSEILSELTRKCDERHRHQQLLGSRARPAARYPEGLCRGMAAPTRGHVKKLRRLIRYLIEVPRVVTEYKFQGDMREMEVFSDSNWAGCRRTARSTSGGVMMRGTHYLKSWSSTQKNVTLSSAEAELLAAVKASGEALGMLQLMSSVGVPRRRPSWWTRLQHWQ